MTPTDLSYREIPLTQGKVAIVDDVDYDYLNQWKWYAFSRTPLLWHAARTYRKSVNKPTSMYMHSLLCECPSGMIVDHINGNGLDNRRANLRIATYSQNNSNRRMNRNNPLGFKGVFRLPYGRYQAKITYQKVVHFLGIFDTPEEAHYAYLNAAKKIHGEFANPGS